MSTEYAKQQLAKTNPEGHSSLIPLFEQSCRLNAEKPVYACMGQSISFADLGHMSRQFAAFLVNGLGLQKGDRIAIQLPNLIQYPVVAWGALRAGLIVVNTNPLYTEYELLHQLKDSGARALIMLSDNQAVMEKVVPQTAIEFVVSTNVFDMLEQQPCIESEILKPVSLPEALCRGEDLTLPAVDIDMDDLALLQYTGGTTGVAKGSMLSHGNLFAAMHQSVTAMPPEPDKLEVMLAPMPLYHIYGFTTNIVLFAVQGGLSVLIPDPRDINSFVQTMKQYSFTAMAGVNTLYTALMMHPDFDEVDFSHLQYSIAGGAAMVKSVAERWQQRTGSDIYEGWGLSETASMGTLNTKTYRQLGTAGKPLIGMEIKVVDKEGNDLGKGQEGELLIRGAQVMQGYWQRPEATAESIDKDGWFRTGDVGVIEEDDFVRIVDRLKDMILVSGFNVYPNEIEDAVCRHPDVVECAVVGVPDEKSGEAVKLFLTTLNKTLAEDDIKGFCREQLTAYKVPRYVEFLDELPKSAVGKILRRELKA
ncbi:Long-chain-fatty-acid--CoA ligase [Sinobacterium norvegicum]|uniref:Long-chain-fatty-acid--CoA ligase n=1 Tax=Sinobacterium norvegicum TaxID=1641715 RepID=A0ABN8EEB0_9GAMM|nr:AMP-binding protein [Sinobacterium norvegicum]CAH0990673.1 Long-chain-fatty-acid--CoA ligase [Sinobacterium norvegicum]